MLAFFAHLYREWAAAALGRRLRFRAWLRETQLFRKAWGTAMVGDARGALVDAAGTRLCRHLERYPGS